MPSSLRAIALVWLLVLLGAASPAPARGSDGAALEALAARIPAEVLGQPMESTTADGAWLFEGSEDRPGAAAAVEALATALAAADRSLADLHIVNGSWFGEVDYGLASVHQVPGMSGEALLAGLVPALTIWYDDPQVQKADLGGHAVTLLSDGPLDPATADLDSAAWQAVWADDDVVWSVTTSAAILDATMDLLARAGGGPAAATAAELIAADVEAGAIDADTGLLYRILATVGDPDLPERYAGLPAGEDHAAMTDALLRMPSLPPAIADALSPYTVRPTDPRSAFHEPADGVALASIVGASSAHGPTCGPDGWSRLASDSLPLVVWAPCSGARGTDGLTSTLGILEELYPPMVALMGDPIPDAGGVDGGGDPSIDVYLVEHNSRQSRGQGGRDATWAPPPGVRGEVLAFARPTSPLIGSAPPYRSSGTIIIRRDLVGPSPAFRSALAHELFHVLQFAHNLTGVRDGSHDHWFTEASAVWAEHHFVPQARSGSVYPWLEHFQTRAPSGLTDWIGASPYSAFVWPLFMEQERGPGSIGAAWRAIEGKAGRSAVNAAIGSVVPFDSRFGEFAVRAWNGPLPGKDGGDAVDPRFQALDPEMSEIEPGPVKRTTGELVAWGEDDPPIEFDARVAPLAARYVDLTVAADIEQIVIDLSRLQPAGSRTAEALLHMQEGWVRRPLTGDRSQLCLSSPATRFDRMILVLADHDPETPIGDVFTIQALDEPCDLGSYVITLEGFWPDGTPKRANGTWSGRATVECIRSRDGGWQIGLGALDDPRRTVGILHARDDGALSQVSVVHELDLDLDHWWLDRTEGDAVSVNVTEAPASTTVRIEASGTWFSQTQHIEGTLTCSSVLYVEG